MGISDNQYTGFLAEFYDLLHLGLPDVDAYVRFAGQYGPRVLELGCGSGRILIPLARAGFQVTGLDMSCDMMARLKSKLEYETDETRANLTLVKGDMTDFHLGTTYDLVIAPCNMFNHLLSSQKVVSALVCVREHLKDEGTFIMDFSLPDLEFMQAVDGRERTFEVVHPVRATRIVYKFTVNHDFARQLQREYITIREYMGKSLVQKQECRQTMRYYFPEQMRDFLKQAGFFIFEEQDSLMYQPSPQEPGELVLLCRKHLTT